MLTFHKAAEATDAVDILKKRLIQALSTNQHVLWLVSGGSNVPLSLKVMNELPIEITTNLTIVLVDERYGEYNHPDSNMFQLESVGFDSKNATVIPILTPENLTLDATCEKYNQAVSKAFDRADITIGQLGLGDDGHIAGILPVSSAITSKDLVACYQAEKYTRITLTPLALKHIDVAYVFAYGKSKYKALSELRDKTLSVEIQPAQILKQLMECHVYNDQIGGETI